MIEIKHKVTGEVLRRVEADRLGGQNLAGANLTVADLARADLAGTNLEGAGLAVADLSGANLSGANLSAANLTGANLQGADLTGATLRKADLTGANLRKARLANANLEGANLHGADLTGAHLGGANLQQANLARACLESAVLTGARFESGTLYPDTVAAPEEPGAATPFEPPRERHVPGEAFRGLSGLQSRHVQARVDQGVLVLAINSSQVEGEEVADAVRQELLDAVTVYELKKVVVDFQNVRFISSVAFRPLLSLRRKLKEVGGRLILCGLSKIIGDVFYTTRLVSDSGEVGSPFELQPDVPAAVARLNSAE